MMEKWKDIEGYEGLYQVSNYGNVKSLPRIRKFGKNYCLYDERILKEYIQDGSYPKVSLYKNNIRKKVFVHRLVCLAFIPMIDGKNFVNHIDGNKTNNHVTNLEWCTTSENQIHAFKNGLREPVKGENIRTSKLTQIDVDSIRELHTSSNYKLKELADLFGVTAANVCAIVNYKTWK